MGAPTLPTPLSKLGGWLVFKKIPDFLSKSVAKERK
jgi:hypothetical protein